MLCARTVSRSRSDCTGTWSACVSAASAPASAICSSRIFCLLSCPVHCESSAASASLLMLLSLAASTSPTAAAVLGVTAARVWASLLLQTLPRLELYISNLWHAVEQSRVQCTVQYRTVSGLHESIRFGTTRPPAADRLPPRLFSTHLRVAGACSSSSRRRLPLRSEPQSRSTRCRSGSHHCTALLLLAFSVERLATKHLFFLLSYFSIKCSSASHEIIYVYIRVAQTTIHYTQELRIHSPCWNVLTMSNLVAAFICK